MQLTFWGTRGSVPVPDSRAMQYGGNTCCVSVEQDGQQLIIDAGTGIRRLGELLQQRGTRDLHLLVTHTHWDHIHGFPFFAPVYDPAVRLRLRGCPRCLPPLRRMFDRQMALEYFPVAFADLRATIEFAEVPAGGEDLGPCRLRLCPVNHPAPTVGVRVDCGSRALVFITDNELQAAKPVTAYPRLVEFCRGAQLLVHDAQFTDAEYPRRRGWGHSTCEQVLQLARDAGCGQVVFFHHDPARLDEELARLEQDYQTQFTGRVSAAREGDTLTVT